jgi:DNA-3-methyladenine glycosylase
MTQAARLSRDFYARDTVSVARALLGRRLVRVVAGAGGAGRIRLNGRICETEAYGGPDDPSSHAFRRTPRSEIMFGAPGFAYVYFIYGTHHCINAVTEPAGIPGAVLIRAVIPDENVAEMRRRRGMKADAGGVLRGVADGPGKLCQALGITLAENGVDLAESDELFVEEGAPVAEDQVQVTPRVGVRGDAEARGRPWRFVWLAPPR